MELNRGEIIKALECCIINHNCTGCPFHEYYHKNSKPIDCLQIACENALALIKELTEDNENLNQSCTNLIQTIKDVQADTVRKMQERIEKKILEINPSLCGLLPFIDQIAKEVLGENK